MGAVAILFIFLFSCLAWAETPLSGEADLGEIVAEEEISKESLEKPSAFSSIIHPKKFKLQMRTLPEVLTKEVGVYTKETSGLGHYTTLQIRGSSSEQVAVFVDGIRINTPQGYSLDFSTLPLNAADRVEVIRGGGSSRFGGDAIGGVVNIVSQQAVGEKDCHLALTGGSFWTARLDGGISKRFEKWGFQINHTHLNSQGDFKFKSTPLTIGGRAFGGGQTFTGENNAILSENLFSRFDFAINKNWSATWVNNLYYSDRDVSGTEAQVIEGLPLNAHENLARNTMGLKWVGRNIGVQNLNLTFLPSVNLSRSHFMDLTPALGGAIDVTYLNVNFTQQASGDYFKAFSKHNHAFKLLYELGVDYFRDDYSQGGAAAIGRKTRLTNALLLQDEISLWQEKLYLNPSLRFQHALDFGSEWAGHLGIILKPMAHLYFKVNVGNSFRFPNFTELYLPNLGYLRGNPQLSKESAFNFDGGIGVKFSKLEAEVVYFRNDIANSIIFVPVSAYTIAPINTNDLVTQGIETNLTVRPVSFLELKGNYTFLDSSFESSSAQLPGRPRHKINGSIELSNAWGALFAEVNWVDDLPIDFANTTFIKNRTLVDVGGTLKFKKFYFLTVQVKNVSNVSTLDARGFPLPGIQAYVTVGYKS